MQSMTANKRPGDLLPAEKPSAGSAAQLGSHAASRSAPVMSEHDSLGESVFDTPFLRRVERYFGDVPAGPRTLGIYAQEMFGMSLRLLMLCIAAVGLVGGILLGLALDGTHLQQTVFTLLRSIF
jgi:hypothetical protein